MGGGGGGWLTQFGISKAWRVSAMDFQRGATARASLEMADLFTFLVHIQA